MKVYKITNRRFFHEKLGKGIIHVEAPHLTSESLIKHLKKYNSKCYCICPVNYSYVQSNFGSSLNQEQFEKFTKKFYLQLKEMGINLQLHVHLSIFPERMSFEEKSRIISSAFNFFKNELGIVPREIVFGWTTYDQDCLEICKRLNLEPIKNRHYHIYDFWLIKR